MRKMAAKKDQAGSDHRYKMPIASTATPARRLADDD